METEITTLNELTNLTNKLRNQRAIIQKQISELDEQIRAVEHTMHLLNLDGKASVTNFDNSIIFELHGKTYLGALEYIASKNNNIIKVTDAKRLMVQAGLIKNAKNALSMLYTIIARSEKFKKISPGEYKLIDSQQNLIINDDDSPF